MKAPPRVLPAARASLGVALPGRHGVPPQACAQRALQHTPPTRRTPQTADHRPVPARPPARHFISHRCIFCVLLCLIPKQRQLFLAGGPRRHARAHGPRGLCRAPRAPRAHVGVRAHTCVRACSHARARTTHPHDARARPHAHARTRALFDGDPWAGAHLSRPDSRCQHFACVIARWDLCRFPPRTRQKATALCAPPPCHFESGDGSGRGRGLQTAGTGREARGRGTAPGTAVQRTQRRVGARPPAAPGPAHPRPPRASSARAAPAARPGAGSEASRTRAWLAGGSRRGRGPRIPAPPAGAAAGAAGRRRGSCEPRKTSGGIFCHRRPAGQERGR